MSHTKFLSPHAVTGKIGISLTKSLTFPPVTAETAEHAVAKVGQYLSRYGLVLVLAWIGVGHYAHPASIQPLITHSPLLSWLYGIFNTHTLGDALGSTEILAGLLIALRPLWSRVSAVGSAFAVLLFCGTISFLFTTPGVTSSGPVLSMLGEFLLKDVVLLGVSLWTLADSIGAHRRTRSASWGHSAAGASAVSRSPMDGRELLMHYAEGVIGHGWAAETGRPPALRAAVWVLAITGPAFLTLAALPQHSALFRGGFQFSALVLVVTLAVAGLMRPALTALLLTMLGRALFFAPVFMTMTRMSAGLLPSILALAGFAVAGALVSKQTRKLAHLAAEQTAFRRVAMLVAHAVSEKELFAAAAEEAGLLTGADYVRIGRYQSGNLTGVAAWRRMPRRFGACGRLAVLRNLTRAVSRADRWDPIEDIDGACGPLSQDARAHGVLSAAVHPIRSGGRTWGVLLTGSTTRWPPQACARRCENSFANLLGAALSNAENLAALTASRARVLAAADEARRQIERDLHDGAQQRLISLALAVRTAQAAVPPASGRLADELASVANGLTSALDDLRELARGIHPSVLSEGGLVPALKALARRSIVPVQLDVQTVTRLPEPVEVTAYYVICEALANAVKHSNASVVQVGAEITGNVLHLRARDDGDGGADPTLGTGLMGLKDRVEALGGTIAIHSPAGAGTRLDAELPLAA